MTETDLRSLIAEILAETLARQARPTPRTNALVLFSGASLGFEESIAALGRARDAVNLDWIQTDSASRILDQAAIEAVGMTQASTSLVVSHELLIVPTLTVNLAAKVVRGIGDCLASNVMAEFIMSGKPVIAVTNAACPDSADKQGWFPAIPEGYATMLRDNLSRLASFGVRLTTAGRLDRAIERAIGSPSLRVDCELKVISEAVVASFTPNSTVRIGSQSLVTDLAREAAASAQITLERN